VRQRRSPNCGLTWRSWPFGYQPSRCINEQQNSKKPAEELLPEAGAIFTILAKSRLFRGINAGTDGASRIRRKNLCLVEAVILTVKL
jgi:hypothetical protein